jgi:NAD(P)-dependent dehydrogenase (short-subunit alcohol dehydrogenase family)
MQIKGNTAIITGSSGKLGSRIALALAERGCDCICHYNTNKAGAEDLVSRIEAMGQKAWLVEADLTDETQIPKLFGFPRKPTILINSAAIFERIPIGEITQEKAEKTFATNTIAPLLVSKAFVKNLTSTLSVKSPARIINIADVGGQKAWAQYSLYCASKAAMIAMTQSLAKELAPDITVNAVSPGMVDIDSSGKDNAGKKLVPPEDVISAIMFLLENDHITGQVITVDN